jgi:hypothetical protein
MGEGPPEGGPPAGGCCVTAGGNEPTLGPLPTPAALFVTVHLVLAPEMGTDYGQLLATTLFRHDGAPLSKIGGAADHVRRWGGNPCD